MILPSPFFGVFVTVGVCVVSVESSSWVVLVLLVVIVVVLVVVLVVVPEDHESSYFNLKIPGRSWLGPKMRTS